MSVSPADFIIQFLFLINSGAVSINEGTIIKNSNLLNESQLFKGSALLKNVTQGRTR